MNNKKGKDMDCWRPGGYFGQETSGNSWATIGQELNKYWAGIEQSLPNKKEC